MILGEAFGARRTHVSAQIHISVRCHIWIHWYQPQVEIEQGHMLKPQFENLRHTEQPIEFVKWQTNLINELRTWSRMKVSAVSLADKSFCMPACLPRRKCAIMGDRHQK